MKTRLLALFIAASALLGSTHAAEVHFFEAETMPVDGVNWILKDNADQVWWYTDTPSRGKFLNGANGTATGSATQTVVLATSGTYNVWVRYADCQYYRGPFAVTVKQGGTVKGVMTNDLVSLHAADNPTGQAKWGADYQNWVWTSQQLALSAGSNEIVISKNQAMSSWLAPYVDCFVLTSVLTNEPAVSDFAPALYVKVKLATTQTERCVIHLFGKRPYAPYWYLPHVNFYSNRVAVNDYYTGYVPGGPNTNFLSAGCESPWLSLASILTPVQPNTLWFTAVRDYIGQELGTSSYSVIFSTNASDTGIIRQFSRTGKGHALLVQVDMTNFPGMQDDLGFSQTDATQANFGVEVPARFPVVTGCGVGGTYQPATFSNELAVMKALGYNGIGAYDPGFYSNGLNKVSAYIFDTWGLWSNNCMCAIRTNDLRSAIAYFSQSYITAGVISNVLAWYFTDEPGSITMDHMQGCSICAATFRTYLQGQGLQPSNFGAVVWGDVYPTNSGSGNPQVYYQSVRFRSQVLANYCQASTDYLHEFVPDAETSLNFAEELTINGNLLVSGADWFTNLRQGAMSYGWSETWLTWSASYQLAGYRADFMRSASPNGKFGFYNIMNGKTPWDTAAIQASLIGHGARSLYDYIHGPTWIGNGDGNSSDYAKYPTLHKMHAAIARVENSLMGAQVPTSRCALVYAEATDIWTLNDADGYSEYGKERMGLFLLLRHLGVAVDILNEDDIASGRLAAGGYKAAFLSGSHLRRDAAQALVTWTTNGGCFYFNAGSFSSDEFNQPLNLDASLGISRQAYVFKQHCGREIYELPITTNNDPFTIGGTAVEGIIGVQKLNGAPPTNLTVLATFNSDASPALLTKPCGLGRVIFCGAFPGLAYQKNGVLVKQSADLANPARSMYEPPSYADAYRWLFSAALSGVDLAPSSVADDYRIEACMLAGTNSTVVTLANWTGQTRSNVVVRIPIDRPMGTPVAALGAIVGVATQDMLLSVTLDRLDDSDYITIPRLSSVAVPSSEWTAYNDAGWTVTQTAARVTVYSAAPNSVGIELGGRLRHYGSDTGLVSPRVDFSAVGSSPQVNAGTAPPPPLGSDADKLFSGRVNLDGWFFWSTGNVGLVYSGLNPDVQYDVALYANRGAYPERYTDVRISGVLGFTNHSSTGAILSSVSMLNDKTRLPVYNTNGLVFRYDNIRPGTNGQIAFTLSGLNLAGSNAYVNAFMIRTTPAENLLPVPSNPPGWSAYNDFNRQSGELSVNNTAYTAAGTGAGGGALVNFSSGQTLAAQLDLLVTTNASPIAEATNQTTIGGSDVVTVFGGKVSPEGSMRWVSPHGLTVTFSQLNATKTYTVALVANRGVYTPDRFMQALISDVDAFVNQSSAGAILTTNVMANDRAELSSEDGMGPVFKYVDIQPGSDGDIVITMTPAGGYTACLNALMIQEQTSGMVDVDADGMDDMWEGTYFGGTNAANGGMLQDWDNDGSDNYSEYRAGTDPTSTGSKLEMTDLTGTNAPGSAVIRWSSVSSKTYAVLFGTNLLTPLAALQTNIAATPPVNVYTAPVGNVKGYIRIKVE